MAYERKPNTGKIWTNNYKQPGDKKPDFKGKVNVAGREYEIALWSETDRDGKPAFSAKFSEPYQKPAREIDDIDGF